MTCTEFERLLDQKQPDAQTEGALQRHAEQCAHCRMLLELRQLDAEEQVPEEVTARWQGSSAITRDQMVSASRNLHVCCFGETVVFAQLRCSACGHLWPICGQDNRKGQRRLCL